jgi:hypothetical protein
MDVRAKKSQLDARAREPTCENVLAPANEVRLFGGAGPRGADFLSAPLGDYWWVPPANQSSRCAVM